MKMYVNLPSKPESSWGSVFLVGEVTDPESEGTKSGEENARSRLIAHRRRESIRQKN